MSEPVNPYPRSAAVRGFLYWLNQYESRRPCMPKSYSRCLVRVHWLYRAKHNTALKAVEIRQRWREPTGIQTHGTCCWCLHPCKPRQVWHTYCCKAMMAAKGLVADVYKKALIPVGPCEDCGLSYEDNERPEIDHRIALSVAWERRRLGDGHWWRAWTLGNLRWLCHACHVKKTAKDRRLLADLRKGQRRLLDDSA